MEIFDMFYHKNVQLFSCPAMYNACIDDASSS